MTSSSIARIRAAKASAAAMLAGALSSKRPLTVDGDQAAGQGGAGPGQGLQADAAAAGGEQRLGRGITDGSTRSSWPLLEEPALDEPFQRVPPAVPGGARPTGLVARITRRPAASSSSAIW